MREEKDKLRKCPTCGSEINDIGMRDYSSWLFDTLPGKASASDLDCVIERNGHFLGFEFKPTKWVTWGQRIMFNALVDQGWDIYIIVDKDFPNLLVTRWNLEHLNWYPMHADEVKGLVNDWWAEASGAS